MLSAGAGVASALSFGATPSDPFVAILLSLFSGIALFMAGLAFGNIAAVLAAAVGIAGVSAMHGLIGGLNFAVSFAIPVAVLVRQAMLSRETDGGVEWYPAGLLTATLTVIGLTLAMLLTTVLPWLGIIDQAETMLRHFAENVAADTKGVTVDELMVKFSAALRLLPGVLSLFWMMVLLSAGAAAQALLTRMCKNLRPAPDFAGMELPNWMAPVAAATSATAMFAPDPVGHYALSMAFPACFPFLVQGLAVVHAYNRKIHGGTILLLIFYLLVFGPVWPAVLVVLLGAIEQFAGFRRGWKETDA